MKLRKKPESQGNLLLRELLAKGKRLFNSSDAATIAAQKGIANYQLNKILSELAKHGLVIRLRRGLYAFVGLVGEHAYLPSFAIATYLIQPSAISHWSALQYHGLTDQVPQLVTASTPNKVVTPSMRIKSVRHVHKKHIWEIRGIGYEYITIQKQQFFGIEKIWIDENFQIPITDKERTLLDVFIYAKMFGGMGEVLGILEGALPNIDINKLINYAIQYNKQSVIKRLGWVLEYLGVASKLLAPLLKVQMNYYCRLDPSRPAKGPCNVRWMIQDNLTK